MLTDSFLLNNLSMEFQSLERGLDLIRILFRKVQLQLMGGLPNDLDDPVTGNSDPGNGTPGSDNASDYYFVVGGKAPSYWNHRFTFNFFCGLNDLVGTGVGVGDDTIEFTTYSYAINDEYTFLQTGVEDDCYYYYNGSPGIPPASTRFAIVGQQPQTLTLTGQSPVTSQFGLPFLYVSDQNQNLVETIAATSVSDDRTQATFPFPSSLSSGAYSLALVNQTNTPGGISTAGTNMLSIASSQTIAGAPFGVSVAGQAYTHVIVNSCTGTSTTSSSYKTLPVVSLYSANQVLVNGSHISVGANPTAVAAYISNQVTYISNEGNCNEIFDDYAGTTRAVVANSGGNSVTVLDIVNNTMLTNITVGNQLVALAVSSDGNTAYVANYKDNTISVVNLTAETVTGTIAVSGQPTSVALTSSGTLWVGGVGFLTEINTSSMTVTATETVSGKTIVALGYSDSVGQIVATTVDGSNNVYADEIDPASVTAGGTYTPLASNKISSLGTHLNAQTQAQVRSFTSTLANQNILNTNQAGAPPLVVQDGWAVVTATPTGFTITDITGKIVLVSEQTPSPVTAIAVDPQLNVAYLTMPDSNIILTVPLPGTNSN